MPLARRAWAEAKKYQPPTSASPAEREHKLNDEWTRIDRLLAAHLDRQRIVAALKRQLDNPTAAGVQEAWVLVEKPKRADDAEMRGLLDDLVKAHREQVVFVPAEPDEKLTTPEDDALPSLSVDAELASRACRIDLEGPRVGAGARSSVRSGADARRSCAGSSASASIRAFCPCACRRIR